MTKTMEWMGKSRSALLGLTLVSVGLLTGCESELNCLVAGDNVRGRVGYGQGITINPDTNLVIQFSTSSTFASAVSTGKTQKNPHGLVTVPYSLCATEGATVYFRAFQDTDGDGTLDSGEASGLFDGTSNGNAAATSKLIPTRAQTESSRVEGIDITLDTP